LPDVVLAHYLSDNRVTQALHAGSPFCGGINRRSSSVSADLDNGANAFTGITQELNHFCFRTKHE
jgi:hypothetical protein